MALSTAVFVGGIESWKDSLIEKARKLKVAPGQEEGADVGPLISPEARQRCIDLITSAEKDVSFSYKQQSSICEEIVTGHSHSRSAGNSYSMSD